MKQLKKDFGFSFIELLISIAILSIAIISISATFSYSLKTSLRANNISMANQAMQEEIEIINLSSFDSLENRIDGAFIGQVASIQKLPQASGKISIETYENNIKIKKITISVSWTDSEGQKTISATTLKSKTGN